MPKTLPESPEWVDGIYQVELDTPVLGGDGGPDNWQAQQLANRTSYLKQRTDMIDDRLQSATGDYASVAEAQAAIDSGSETRRYFNVMLFDNNWVERYENVNGVATPTGIRLPSSQAVDELSASLDEANALIARLTLLTAPLRKYISTKYTFSVNTAEGPVSTGLALDRDMGLWLPGLKAELQQYVQQLIPWSIANRYPGYQLMFTDVTGKKGIVSIDDNGDVRVLGIDDVLQERLAALCSSTFARRINGFQFVIFSSDLKSALFAIDDDGGVHIPGIKGALQDNLGQQPARITPYQGLPAVYWNDALLWHERPVLSVNQVSATGLSMTYIPGGQITKGYGMMYYRGGAEISPEAMKALILCSDGQSLGVPSDAGNRPNPNTWNKVNYDPKWRAYALAIAGGKPEGSQDTPITEAMLDLLANLVYPLYRQGQQLPFVYALLYSHENADLNLPVMFSAVANSGGKSFAQIWKGTVPYSNGLAMVERYVKIAQALASPPALMWCRWSMARRITTTAPRKTSGIIGCAWRRITRCAVLITRR
ncbi:Uncharacterised protein [Serratia liquefaciens]|nr:Uncharacterised protein [Serratia liquefaciens]